MRKIKFSNFQIFILLSIFSIFSVSAALIDVYGDYCADAHLTDLSPSSAEIGEDFTMGILIDNCGEKVPENIFFELIDISPFITIKEPSKIEIGTMGYSNSQRFLVYHMTISDDAEPGDYKIKYKLSYGGGTLNFEKDGNFLVTVIGDKAELNIASLKTNPVLPKEGENVELTMRIENVGKGTAKSVSVYADHPFQGLKQSFIGTLDSDEDGPAVLTFIVEKDGEFEFPVTISYKDDFGDHEIESNIKVLILKKKINWVRIIIGIIISAVMIFLIMYYMKMKRKKDMIIQQLLKGNKVEESKKNLKKKNKK